MKALNWLLSITLAFPLAFIGCKADKPKGPAEKEYDIKGKVVAVAPDKKSVTLDHEDIPGLMKAMEMEFTVEDPKVLEGIGPGDQVQGRLKVKGGDHVITKLEKR